MTTIQDIADKLGISKGTVSKALNNAPDISETLQKQILETAVELGYTKLRRYKNSAKRLCILVQKDFIQYEEPHHFAYDIVMGFRQMAEPEGYEVEIVSVNAESQRAESYDVFMLQNDYSASFVLGFSLNDPWMEDFRTTRTPTVLYDNQIHDNPSIAYIGIDNVEGMELAVSHLRELGHEKIGYLSSALESHIMQVRYNAFFQALRRHGLPDNPELAGGLLLLPVLWLGRESSWSDGFGSHCDRLRPGHERKRRSRPVPAAGLQHSGGREHYRL